jgi:hypothetical protein
LLSRWTFGFLFQVIATETPLFNIAAPNVTFLETVCRMGLLDAVFSSLKHQQEDVRSGWLVWT